MKKEVQLVFDDSRILDIYKGTTVREVLREINDDEIVALKINGSVVSADYEIMEDSYVNYIMLNDRTGGKIYLNGLKYVYIKAIKDLYGSKSEVYVKHALDKGLYTEIKINKKVDASVVAEIKKKMKEICNRDFPIKELSVTRNDAYDYFRSIGEEEKMINYTFMTNDSVTMYELDDEYNYFYYIMPASTGTLKRFDLTLISDNGILLSYPINNVIPRYTPTTKVLEAFKDCERKLENIGIKYVADLNTLITEGKISDLIQTNEIIYDRNMNDIASRIAKDKNIKAVFISGPSSSGKTTSSKKLAMYLKSMGIDSMVISTDDYFVNREDSPRKEDGSYEFEIIDALDIKLFNSHLKKLISGDEVVIPTYNFILGEKQYKNNPVKLHKNQILIVEGLHAVNERLNQVIPRKNKLKLYISPFTTISLDRHNHISTTDVRLLRRMVRDYQHRGYSAEDTLTNWMGMRKSEETYVYPYQRQADIIVNTSLGYEIGVLRAYAEPLLFSISKESQYYEEAIRILKFLKSFLNIPSIYVPNVSVLREFIGDSYFE
ncbi:MAG: hypothetical protein ACI33S_05450 [Bacilli bacterium]